MKNHVWFFELNIFFMFSTCMVNLTFLAEQLQVHLICSAIFSMSKSCSMPQSLCNPCQVFDCLARILNTEEGCSFSLYSRDIPMVLLGVVSFICQQFAFKGTLKNLKLCIQGQGRSLCAQTIEQAKMYIFLSTVHFCFKFVDMM